MTKLIHTMLVSIALIVWSVAFCGCASPPVARPVKAPSAEVDPFEHGGYHRTERDPLPQSYQTASRNGARNGTVAQ